jgi:hypothetical protein
MAVQLSGVAPTLLPPTITGPIFNKATETSAIMQLARRVPLAVNAQTAIPVMMDVPTAGWVSEGGAKPAASAGVGVRLMTGKKVALLVPVSQELAMTNAAGLYDQLSQDLPTAISRAFDVAAIHGVDLASGGAGPFSDYLKKTPNAVALGTAASNLGGISTDLWNGVSKVLNGNVPYEFSGFAADPRLRPELGTSVDANGRPFFVPNAFSANTGIATDSLIGYPVAFNTGVSGKYYRQSDTSWTVTVNGSPTGGTFTLTIGGYTTSAIAYNASAATVQAAIRALGTGTGNPFGGDAAAASATVSGTGPYTVTLPVGAPVYADGSALTGGSSPSVTTAQSTNADTGLRAIGGDFSQCAYGVGMDISIQVSREASYTPDGGTTWISAFQNNLVLLLVEAYFGFVVNDVNAFVKYTHAAGS